MQTFLPLSTTWHPVPFMPMECQRFARTTKAFVSAGRHWRPSARRCRVPVQARPAPSPAPAMRCIAAAPKNTKTPLCGDTKTALARLHKSDMPTGWTTFVAVTHLTSYFVLHASHFPSGGESKSEVLSCFLCRAAGPLLCRGARDAKHPGRNLAGRRQACLAAFTQGFCRKPEASPPRGFVAARKRLPAPTRTRTLNSN